MPTQRLLENLAEIIDHLDNPHYTRQEIAAALRRLRQELSHLIWQHIETNLNQLDQLKAQALTEHQEEGPTPTRWVGVSRSGVHFPRQV